MDPRIYQGLSGHVLSALGGSAGSGHSVPAAAPSLQHTAAHNKRSGIMRLERTNPLLVRKCRRRWGGAQGGCHVGVILGHMKPWANSVLRVLRMPHISAGKSFLSV